MPIDHLKQRELLKNINCNMSYGAKGKIPVVDGVW